MASEHHTALPDPAGRRDILSIYGAHRVIAVPVAPIKRVHRKERQEDTEILIIVHLIFTQELAVYQDGSCRLFSMRVLRRAQSCDEHV